LQKKDGATGWNALQFIYVALRSAKLGETLQMSPSQLRYKISTTGGNHALQLIYPCWSNGKLYLGMMIVTGSVGNFIASVL
jgi:hypothetical protein